MSDQYWRGAGIAWLDKIYQPIQKESQQIFSFLCLDAYITGERRVWVIFKTTVVALSTEAPGPNDSDS